MKLCHLAWIGMLSFCLLSGCAYIQGRNEQNAANQQASKQGKVVDVTKGSVPNSTMSRPNPSETAAKMIAPITQ